MLSRLWKQLSEALETEEAAGDPDHEHAIQVATASLMVEVARADHDFDPEELAQLLALIQAHFQLTPDEATALSERAEQRVEESVSLHEFTRVLHENLSVVEKAHVVGMLWQVAYADGRLDMYEDAMVLKIADLLYVPRTEVMRMKAVARDAG